MKRVSTTSLTYEELKRRGIQYTPVVFSEIQKEMLVVWEELSQHFEDSVNQDPHLFSRNFNYMSERNRMTSNY